MARIARRAAVAAGTAAIGMAAIVAFAVPAATAGAAGTAGTAGTASVATTTAVSTAPATGKPHVCQRLDRFEQRGKTAVARLGAGADTKGSIAWPEAKAEAATKAGNNDRATRLSERAQRRTEALAIFKTLGPQFDAVIKAHCA
ncbi:MAG TPA: hypothetical protein VFC16_12960 [Nakamurella sp.]|nr:hypothetical protein [Nakamurella sp.]